MTQDEVLELIAKSKKGLTSNDLIKKLNINMSCIKNALRKLYKQKLITRAPITFKGKNNIEYFIYSYSIKKNGNIKT